MTIVAVDGTGNTRLAPIASTCTHPDYLRLKRDNMPMGLFTEMLAFIGQSYSTEMDKRWSPGYNVVWYDNKLTGIDGFVGGFTVNDDGSVAVMIDLSGVYFTQLDAVGAWRLFTGFYHRYCMKCTRIDLAIDDYTYDLIPVEQMRKGWEEGENFGFRNYKYIVSASSPDSMDETHYFGSKESGKMVRIYEHGGDRMRFEVEFKRRYAQPIFEAIVQKQRPDYDEQTYVYDAGKKRNLTRNEMWDLELQKAMASYALGAIDFRDRGNRKDKARAGRRDSVRCQYYQEFIDKIVSEVNRIRFQKVERTIRKTVKWFERQCTPSLAMFREGLGRHKFNVWLHEILDAGELRMDKLKQLWVLEVKQKPELVSN